MANGRTSAAGLAFGLLKAVLSLILLPIGLLLGLFANVTNTILGFAMVGGLGAALWFGYQGQAGDALTAGLIGVGSLALLGLHIVALNFLAPNWRLDETTRVRVEYHRDLS